MAEATIDLPAVDLARLNRGPAFDVLRAVVRELRRTPRDQDSAERQRNHVVLTHLAAGQPVTRADAEGALGAEALGILRDVDAVADVNDAVVPTITILFIKGLAVAYPRPAPGDRDQVYVGREGPWLIRVAWDHGPPSGTAADLACGTGVVAAALTARYQRVIATDLLSDAARTARLTLRLNDAGTAVTGSCVTDVAAGLRPGVFDLVVANPPWVPTFPDDDTAGNPTYADGGPTGMELPALFVEQAAGLLAAGGTAVVLVADTTWDDGRRPLDDQLGRLESWGLEARVEGAHPYTWSDEYAADMVARLPGCTEATLVALVFRRPR